MRTTFAPFVAGRAAVLFALALGAGWSEAGYAASRALLVGVSNYGVMQRKLQGPRHDVMLMYGLFRERGFDAAQIRVLADSLDDPAVAGAASSPTRAAILSALGQLVAETRQGDFVVLYFSGHGSQQPVGRTALATSFEPDNLDEVFLPIDAGRWNGRTQTVENVIVDNELGSFIDQLTGRGAFVWVIVDACHSATMTRVADDEYAAVRAIDPRDLGVPQARFATSSRQTAAWSQLHAADARRSARGGYVFFAAAADSQDAIETSFPRTAGAARTPHGMLTWYLAEALTRRPTATFRELATVILAGYGAYQQNPTRRFPRAPTPLFVGDLDRLVLAPSTAATGWTASRVQDDPLELTIAAGVLHGVSEDMEIALRLPLEVRPIARGRAINVGLTGARVRLPAPLDPHFTGATLLAEPMMPRVNLALRVAFAPAGETRDSAEQSALREAVALAQRSDYRRIVIDMVAPDGAPDVLLFVRDGRLWFLTERAGAAAADARPARIASAADIAGFAFRPEGTTRWGHGRTASIPIDADRGRFAQRLEDALMLIAAHRNLLRVLESLAGSPAARDLGVELFVRRKQQAVGADRAQPFAQCARTARERPPLDAERVAFGKVPKVQHCDVLFVRLVNRSDDPIDLTLLYLDGDRAITVPRIAEGGATMQPSQQWLGQFGLVVWDQKRQRPAATGLERLVIIGVVRRTEEDRAVLVNFDWLQQPGLGDHAGGTDGPRLQSLDRSARSAIVGHSRSRSAATLDRLLANATGGSLLRSADGGPVADLNDAFAIVLSWDVRVDR